MAERVDTGRPPKVGETELAKGSLNVAHIVFMVMATVAPAGGAVAILPLAIGLGVGVGTPGMYVFVMAIMLLFAVGFTRMVPHVHNAGAFFAYIVRGLGRPVGLAGAYIATSAYLALAAATGGAMGFFASGSANKLTGVDLPWWVYTLVGLVAAFVLGYFKITLAAGVLGVALVLELIVVLVLDIAIIAKNGLGSLPISSFSPEQVFVPGVVGVGMIFAFSCYQGFEGTAIYAEEAKDPERTIPRATYIAMGCIGLFFVLTSWAFLASSGGATAAAAASPGTFAFDLSDQVRRFGVDDDSRGSDRHQLLRRHAGVPQRGVALHVRPRTRRLPAPFAADPAPAVPVAGGRRRQRLRHRGTGGRSGFAAGRARSADEPVGGDDGLRGGRV